MNWAFLRYTLQTANNWQGPIKDFILTLRKAASSDVISLCLDGELRKLDARTCEFHAQNFRPQRDLGILFVGSYAVDE